MRSAVEGSEAVRFTVKLSKTSADKDVMLPYSISLEGKDTASQADFVDFAGASGIGGYFCGWDLGDGVYSDQGRRRC